MNPRHRRLARARRKERDRVAAFRRAHLAESRRRERCLETRTLVITPHVPEGRSKVTLDVGEQAWIVSHLTVEAEDLIIQSVTTFGGGKGIVEEHLTRPVPSQHFRLGVATAPAGTLYTLTVEAQQAQQITVQLRGIIINESPPSRRSQKRGREVTRHLRAQWLLVARSGTSASVRMSRPK